MPLATASDLVNTLSELNLVTPAQLEELASLRAQCPDPRALARLLVQRNWLTPYQVNLIFQDRAKALVLGSYVILERINEGGMGVIYKAQHRHMKRIVALKVIRKERLERPDVARRFLREIVAASQFDHPNIVRALDADDVDGRQCLVMEYIDGLDLARLVKKNGPLSVPLACEYIRQAALGLQHAFERGVVHRDIKPGNLLVSGRLVGSRLVSGAGAGQPAGTIKILDLGLARMQEPDAGGSSISALTKEGMVMGTPDYIAPEQTLDSHHADTRADLYSLGCTFYFLLTGRPPYPGGTYGEKLLKHRLYPPEPLEKFRPDVPPGVAGVIGKLMAKRPQDRFATPAEVARVLEDGLRTGTWPQFAPVVPVAVPIAALAPSDAGWSTIVNQTASTPASGTLPAALIGPETPHWLPWAIVGITVVSLFLVLIVAWSLTRG